MKKKPDDDFRDVAGALVRVDDVGFARGTDGALPCRMRVLKWGENANSQRKRVFVGEKLVAALSHPLYPFGKIALDFEHNTLPGTEAYAESSEPREVAGFGRVEVVRGEGVFLCMERWTKNGQEMADNYCDLSAVPAMNKLGEVVGVFSVALCKNGSVPGMDFKEVALSVSAAGFAAIAADINITKKDEVGMEWKALIITALGLDPESSDEDVQAALVKALKPVEGESAEVTVEALSAKLSEAFDVKLAAFKESGAAGAKLVALSAKFDTLQAGMLARDKDQILSDALREGKVVALNADAIGVLSLDQLKKTVEDTPVTVPLSARTPEVLKEAKRGRVVTEQDKQIAINCGADPDAVYPSESKA